MDVLVQLKKQIGKAMCALLFDVFNGCSGSVKEINRSIWKGMSNFAIEKNWPSQNLNFIGKKIWRNALTLNSKGTKYARRNVYIGIIVFSYLSSTKFCLSFLLNCFVWEIKGFYQSSFGNEVDFRDIMNVSLNILAKN